MQKTAGVNQCPTSMKNIGFILDDRFFRPDVWDGKDAKMCYTMG
jgi:hypothetical protein